MFKFIKRLFSKKPVDDIILDREFKRRFEPYTTSRKLERLAYWKSSWMKGNIGYHFVRYDLESSNDVRDVGLRTRLKIRYIYGVVVTIFTDKEGSNVVDTDYMFFVDQNKHFRSTVAYSGCDDIVYHAIRMRAFKREVLVWSRGIDDLSDDPRKWTMCRQWKVWLRRAMAKLLIDDEVVVS